MKLHKRSGTYQSANCSFNPSTIEAFSYGWWKFVGVIDGLVIFNSYRYSNTTSKHQWKVRQLMSELGINIDLELQVPAGLPGSGRSNSYLHERPTNLAETIVLAEEYLCDQYLEQEIKREERNERARLKRAEVRNRTRERLNPTVEVQPVTLSLVKS